jgi:hypothetical protein
MRSSQSAQSTPVKHGSLSEKEVHKSHTSSATIAKFMRRLSTNWLIGPQVVKTFADIGNDPTLRFDSEG